MNTTLNEVKKVYKEKKKQIKARLAEFRAKWENGSDIEVLSELAFCILTPQSKAKGCWACVENILKKDLLLFGSEKQILNELTFARFKYKKAKYLVEARNKFVKDGKAEIKKFMGGFDNVYIMREWFVKNIKGYGYKEASHFLRNVGFGDDIAILDRHILRNLKWLGVISKVPESLNRERYLEIEQKMKKFAKKIKVPMASLDLILWAKETGEVFK